MSRQQEFICGLSREVTFAVLPRLNMEELMFELNRRIQILEKENGIKDMLVSILRDVMSEEYRQLERMSSVSPADETTIPVQNLEVTVTTMQEDVQTSHTTPSTPDTHNLSRQVLVVSHPMSTSCMEQPREETPSASCAPTPDHPEIRKWKCHVYEDDQVSQIPQQSKLDHFGHRTVDRETGFSNSEQGQRDKGEEPLICGECDYRACNKLQLVEHMKTHTNEKTVKCNPSKYKMSCKKDLVEHTKRHKDTEPYNYRCEICDYRANRKLHAARHMMCHAGLKPYKCEECNYSTTFKSDLTRHRRRHTGERPYSCQQCDYKAKEKGNLVKHMRNKHK